jgi:mannose-6-phosphate isomerase-like protein (cupin superfamily)
MGHFGLFEGTLDPNSIGASPHTHHEIIEIFYVLNGELDILAGDQRVIGRAGSLVSVPPDVVHAFRNFTAEPVSFLLLFCPAQNREEYFKEVAELAKRGALDDEALRAELDARFDTTRMPNVKFP